MYSEINKLVNKSKLIKVLLSLVSFPKNSIVFWLKISNNTDSRWRKKNLLTKHQYLTRISS